MDVRCECVRAGRATAPGVAFTLQGTWKAPSGCVPKMTRVSLCDCGIQYLVRLTALGECGSSSGATLLLHQMQNRSRDTACAGVRAQL
jgi:hypothetical protein